MAYKTPGVYVEEIASFPASVVPVETAIPAFVGYSEKALDANASRLSFVPTRINSLLEYETLFGGDFIPSSYLVKLNTMANNEVIFTEARDASNANRRYYLYNSIKHFYQNGGGACYIVSVGSYTTAPAYGDTTTPLGLLGGLTQLKSYDEPTLLLFPDAVSLTAVELGNIQKAALTQCADLQDRFVIMDLKDGDKAKTISLDPVAVYRQETGTSNLKYGTAYYPWLKTIYGQTVSFRQLSFIDSSDVAIPNATIDSLATDASLNDLTTDARSANANVAIVVAAVVDILPGSFSITLTRDNFNVMSSHYSVLFDALRATAGGSLESVRAAFGEAVFLPGAIALAFEVLRDTPFADEPELAQIISDLSNDSSLGTVIKDLVAFEKNAHVRGAVASGRSVANVESDYASLNGTPWILPELDVSSIATNTESFGASTAERAVNAAAVLEGLVNKLTSGILSIFESAEFLAFEAEKKLFSQHPIFSAVVAQIQQTMKVLPCSGSIAGVYASVDRARGVWKAPANISLADISGPTIKINDAMQGDLNVHTTGKSVNAIRAFAGKGSLVWGARTLDGNSNEWRYVSVRRFFNMAEESIKKATIPFTFEPNDANTWVRVRAMIENFLTLQWRAGALVGEKTSNAFYVKVGLGETMTAQDILEGRLIIEIGMAVVRPAEFIILKFSHKMQVS